MKYRWKTSRVEGLASYYCTIFQMRNIQGKNIDSEMIQCEIIYYILQ